MNEEKNIVRVVVVILVGVTIVPYILLYNNRKEQNNKVQEIFLSQQVQNKEEITEDQTNQAPTKFIPKTGSVIVPKDYQTIIPTQQVEEKSQGVNLGITPAQSIKKINNDSRNQNQVKYGTTLYTTSLASLQTLGVSPLQILRDSQMNVYYILLEGEYNRREIAQRYNGTVHEIVTQKEIVDNELFGEKVTYINLPQYGGQLVLMTVEINNQQRLMQIDYNQYYKAKKHIKQILTNS